MSLRNASNPVPKNTPDPRRILTPVYAYIRVSSKEQEKRGLSVGDQEKVIRAFCEEHDLEIKDVFRDVGSVGSAKDEHTFSKRPDFNKVCAKAIHERIPIVVTTCSRFSRTFASYKRYEDDGGKLIPVELGIDPDPIAIRALIRRAESEAAQGSRMARDGFERKRAAGKSFGNPRIGDVRHLAAEAISKKAEKSLKALAPEVAKARAAGCVTAGEIAGYLTPIAT